jgi:rRNA-processing protein FCF1
MQMDGSDVASLLTKYASSGVLLDTNILLAYVVGRFSVEKLERFKRTNTFTRKDFAFLSKFVLQFHRIVTTPHVLTEVSNLAAHLEEPDRRSCFASFRKDLSVLHEISHSAVSIAKDNDAFERLGITDAAIPAAAEQKFLVLTDDLPLYRTLCSNGVEAINFNHIRLSGWGV